jgi:hypothetical protein
MKKVSSKWEIKSITSNILTTIELRRPHGGEVFGSGAQGGKREGEGKVYILID